MKKVVKYLTLMLLAGGILGTSGCVLWDDDFYDHNGRHHRYDRDDDDRDRHDRDWRDYRRHRDRDRDHDDDDD